MPRDFSSLLRIAPPSSPSSPGDDGDGEDGDARAATWRRIFEERELVWAPHNLITPSVVNIVEAETQRLMKDSSAREIQTNSDTALSRAARDALRAKADAFVAKRTIPAVEIAPSNMPVGFGLFASEALDAGEIIGEYTGLVCSVDDVEEDGAYAYQAWPGSPLAIDACTAGNHTRFVNHAPKPNLDIVQCVVDSACTWHVLYVARRKIEAGEELFVHYGDTYWRRRRMMAP